jgi:hypothetical protein
MRIKRNFIIVFLTAFFIGILSCFFTLDFSIPKAAYIEEKSVVEKNLLPAGISPQKLEIKEAPEILEENNELENEDESKFKVKLLETGEGFHGKEIKAKSDEVWFGLFKKRGKYFLRSTKIKVRPGFDAVLDYVGKKSGKDIKVEGKNEPLFLVKNADFLKQGEIETVFDVSDDEDSGSLQNGFIKDFVFNGEKYTLRVDGGKNSSALILETDNIRQVLFYVGAMGDSTWNLYWVGDLDKDGKLDLYADLPVFYNFSQKRLFLSSQAGNGKLVKQVAMFHTSGC